MHKLKKDNKKDFKKAVIEKTDTYEFTLEDADKRQGEYKTYEREWEAQIRVCKAVIDNINRNHPKIAKMPESEIVAAKMYKENDDMIKEYTVKLKELKKAIKNYESERKDILEKFGWSE